MGVGRVSTLAPREAVDGIARPNAYGAYQQGQSSTPLWDRVRNRARILFSVDRTPHEQGLIFEALQDANLRIVALEKREEALRLRDNA